MENKEMENAVAFAGAKRVVVEETDTYITTQEPDGKYKRTIKYMNITSSVPETDEEKIKLYKVMNEQSDANKDFVIPMKEAIGKKITVEDFYTRRYESFDEDTGQTEMGVVTYLKDTSGVFYTTSSKLVYFSLLNIKEVFPRPFNVVVEGIKREKGRIQINIVVA